MSVGLHNAGWMWLSTGFDAMCEEGIIDPKDLAQKARRVRNPVGLIAQAENKGLHILFLVIVHVANQCCSVLRV